MDIQFVDHAIDRYVEFRRTATKESSFHYLSTIVGLRHNIDTSSTTKQIGGLARYYQSCSNVFSRPTRTLEFGVALANICLITPALMTCFSPGAWRVGAVVLAGLITNLVAICRHLAQRWCEGGVMAATYREIAEWAVLEQK